MSALISIALIILMMVALIIISGLYYAGWTSKWYIHASPYVAMVFFIILLSLEAGFVKAVMDSIVLWGIVPVLHVAILIGHRRKKR